MHPTDVGYVPRKVGLHGHLLELCGGTIREPVESLLNPVIILTPQSTQTYVYSVVYMASHEPEKYSFSTPAYFALFATLLTAYYMWVARKISYCYGRSNIVTYRWDTSMSQKSRFKMQTQGNYNYRWTFPQLPWGTIKNPTYIQTAHG